MHKLCSQMALVRCAEVKGWIRNQGSEWSTHRGLCGGKGMKAANGEHRDVRARDKHDGTLK